MSQKKAIVLLSGGLDSATTLFMARAQGFALYAMSFAYGQRQAVELAAARVQAQRASCVAHKVVEIDLRTFGGSALTSDVAVPKGRADIGSGVPITYVPARNTIFLSYALAWAEVVGAYDLFIGANIVDYSGYPDCRPEFLQAFAALANLATRAGVEGSGRFAVQAPLLHLTKAEIITQGMQLGVDYASTHSCYDPAGDRACGGCDACILRRDGFAQAGVPDPTAYADPTL
jgi:7-cyano-7-deazaguanine synthase